MQDASNPNTADASSAVPPPPEQRHPFLRLPGKRRFLPDRETLKRPCKRQKYDPMKLLYAVDYQHYLRNEEQFVAAMEAGRRYDHDPSDTEYEPRDSRDDPSTSTRARARHRTDIVCLLLERREVTAWLEEDLIESIQVYSDASPCVGVELQGQILDFCLTNGNIYRRVLPGAELAYGMTDATSKAVTLLWGIWLACGPGKAQVRKILSLISAITTDNGTEINLLLLPDILDAYYLWMAGEELRTLKDKIVPGSRLFCNSLRLIGCGHTFGGIMETICNSHGAWSTLNVQIRSLVHFFGNQTYRKHLQHVLRSTCAVSVLDHFTATFIKWRYATLALAVAELIPLEDVCRQMQAFHFNDVQDKESMKKAMAAAHDPELWKWLLGPGHHVVRRIEQARHWFMVCNCPEHRDERHEEGTQAPCGRKGRRLREVKDFVTKEPGVLRKAANDLKPEDVGGDRAVCTDTKTMLRKYAALFETRTKYFKLIPWLYVLMDTAEGARTCLEQFAAAEFDALDPLSKRLGTTLKPDMEIVAGGGEPSQAIRVEVRRLENACLMEDPGEGYHRGATYSAHRAPGATTQTIVQEIRLKDALALVEESVDQHGASARDIIRWEWRNYKRILQHDPRRYHRNVQLSPQQVYDRVHRMDARARDNWTVVVDPQRADPPHPFEDNVDAVQREYVRAVLDPGAYYEIERRSAPPITASTDAVVDEALQPGAGATTGRRIFQVMEKHYGSTRPKLMRTLQSYRDVTLHAKIALLVQAMGVRTSQGDGTTLSCYPEGDPVWVDHCELGGFDDLVYRMYRFFKFESDPTDHECFVLTDRRAARPSLPITDEACPVLSILWYLQSKDWKQNRKICSHSGKSACEGVRRS